MHRSQYRTAVAQLILAALISTASGLSPFPSEASGACVNESLRTGPSATLPDCRAYELVTPPDADGRQFRDLEFIGSKDVFPTELATRDGESFLFGTRGSSLLTPEGGGGSAENDVYEARRLLGGWQAGRYLSPRPYEAILPEVGGISADHAYLFVHVGPVGPVTKESGEFGTLYEGGDASYLGDPGGHFELLGIGTLGTEKLAQGRYISAGGQHVIFSTGKFSGESAWCEIAISKGRPCAVKQLEPDASPSGTGAIYDRAADGATNVVSLLPGDQPLAAGEEPRFQGVSADGSVVAFKVAGTLYVRVDNATTLKVTGAVTEFGGLSDDGRYLFYVAGGNIHRFDTETEADVQLNSSGDGEMVNVAADGSHVYFVSKQQLDGSEGTAGKPNLYVWSGGAVQYIATVEQGDLEGTTALTAWVKAVSPEGGLGLASSRLNADGSVVVFESQAQLTSYANAGHTEIYRYDANEEDLQCVSCNPGGTPASADARLQNLTVVGALMVVRNLSDDGNTVVFETDEALAEADTDGITDIYEWHQPAAGGDAEVSLITSGKSKAYGLLEAALAPNSLFGVSADGGDIFFSSQDELTPTAGVEGVPAIFDARVGGGVPEPQAPNPCMEEGCRPPATPPPSLGGFASSVVRGAGNVVPKKKKRSRHGRCRKRGTVRKHCGKRRSGARVSSAPGAANAANPATAGASQTVTQPAGETPTGIASSASEARANGAIFDQFGIKSVAAEVSTPAAAGHPDFMTDLEMNPPPAIFSSKTKEVVFNLPPGLYGNPNLTPRCATGDFLGAECPVDSQVGVTKLTLGQGQHLTHVVTPVYNLQPPHPDREIARFGVLAAVLPVFIDISVRTADDYEVTATIHNAPSVEPLFGAETTLWGDPADPSHDELRMTVQEANECGTACHAPGGKRPSGLPPIAFMTNPSTCQQGEVGFSAISYQLPGQVFSKSAQIKPGPFTECQGLPFAPSFSAQPTSHRAGSPTGLKVALKLPQTTDPTVRSTATMQEARVSLPSGMGISSSAADGLAACSDEQVHFHEELSAECPDASKLGTATIVSPALSQPLEGALYQRSPGEKGHLFRLWLVSDDFGLHIKIPGQIETDQATGQVTAVFSDLPQVAVEEIDLDVWGGPRAPLKNPDSCGTYQTAFSFKPHSNDPAATGQTSMTINEGCEPRGFDPKLHGGVTNPKAGAFSPFVLDLARDDSEQGLAGFEVTLPKGLLAKLKGVSLCPDAQAGAGDCPANSRIGSLIAAAGAGPNPLWLPQPGKSQPAVYLAGPYKGAPFSVVSAVPAEAGPFDLGNVVVRSALIVDPETAVATVKTDPLPQFVEGVPVIYRHLHVLIDRPEFTLNPTNCSELALTSSVFSTEGMVTHPSERFQVDGCRGLAFKPKLSFTLNGGTERGDYPALRATLRARRGDANLGKVSAALPHSEFLAQEHIVTICTRPRFAAHNCPKGSIYGSATAWTPLLSKPLKGPVYLRSNPSHELPDLVMDLRGQIEIAVAGRIDSFHQGIRATFETVPDAPLSKFVLRMRGGKKGLLINSTNTCVRKHRAHVNLHAQNGRTVSLMPVLTVRCGKRGGNR